MLPQNPRTPKLFFVLEESEINYLRILFVQNLKHTFCKAYNSRIYQSQSYTIYTNLPILFVFIFCIYTFQSRGYGVIAYTRGQNQSTHAGELDPRAIRPPSVLCCCCCCCCQLPCEHPSKNAELAPATAQPPQQRSGRRQCYKHFCHNHYSIYNQISQFIQLVD